MWWDVILEIMPDVVTNFKLDFVCVQSSTDTICHFTYSGINFILCNVDGSYHLSSPFVYSAF